MLFRVSIVLLIVVAQFSTGLFSVDSSEVEKVTEVLFQEKVIEEADKPQQDKPIPKPTIYEEKIALEFLNSKIDKYNRILHFFWKNLGDEQTWHLNAEYRNKKTDEKKFKKDKARVNAYVDLKQLKSMLRVSSRFAYFKAFSDSNQTLFVSRDTKQWCLHKSQLKDVVETMKKTKNDKKAWETKFKALRDRFFAESGLSHLKLQKELENFEGEKCQVLSFSRGQGVNYRLYFLANSGWLRGIKLHSTMTAVVSVMSNAQGYPAKFTAQIKNFTQGENKYDFSISGSLQWKQGKFIDGKLLLKTVFQELLDIELEMELKLNDTVPLRENVFEPSFKRDSYQLKSFDDFKKELLNHAVGVFTAD